MKNRDIPVPYMNGRWRTIERVRQCPLCHGNILTKVRYADCKDPLSAILVRYECDRKNTELHRSSGILLANQIAFSGIDYEDYIWDAVRLLRKDCDRKCQHIELFGRPMNSQ